MAVFNLLYRKSHKNLFDFTAPKTKKKKVQNVKYSSAPDATQESSASNRSQPPTQDEIRAFYEELEKSGKPSLLSIDCDKCIVDDLPTPLSDLFQWDFLNLSYTELMSKCESVFASFEITTSQAKRVESLTRDQAKSKYWYHYGAGRVMASSCSTH